MVHERDVGIFIATGGYTAAAQDFARIKGNLKLVDGVEFVGLIEKYYDGLDLKFRKQIPLRRMLVPRRHDGRLNSKKAGKNPALENVRKKPELSLPST